MGLKIKVFQIFMMSLTIVLMVLPSGIAFKTSSDPGLDFINYYSYFSDMPFGYGNWAPLITALLSIAVIVLLIFSLNSFKTEKSIKICLSISIILMINSFIMFSTFTLISLFVTIIHGIVLFLQMEPNWKI